MPQVRVLIFDHHAASRWIAHYVLSMRGYACHTVAKPDDAVSAVETFAPDAFLYEWSTRDPSTASLGRRVRTASAIHGRALFVVVASAVDEPAGFVTTEGVDAYFLKPIAFRDVAVALDARFGIARSATAE